MRRGLREMVRRTLEELPLMQRRPTRRYWNGAAVSPQPLPLRPQIGSAIATWTVCGADRSLPRRIHTTARVPG